MEEVGFMTYIAASHQVEIQMFWLHTWGTATALFIQSIAQAGGPDDDGKVQVENHSSKNVSDGSVSFMPVKKKMLVVINLAKGSASRCRARCLKDFCSKWGMSFAHQDVVFSLSLLSKWNWPFCICSSRGSTFQHRCQVRGWWMGLLNPPLRYCIIVCHCSQSFYLLGQDWQELCRSSTPAFHTSSPWFHLPSAFTPASALAPSFPSPRWFQDPERGCFFSTDKKRRPNWWCCRAYCAHCFPTRRGQRPVFSPRTSAFGTSG